MSAAPDSTRLLAPLALGARTLANRIVFGAHLTNFGEQNAFGARHRAYYAARAAGGAGLIVTEALTVHPLDWPYEHVPFGHRDAIVGSLGALAAAVRAAGPRALLMAQLNHWGGQSDGKLLRQSPWAPSANVEVASKRMARAMEPDQIEAVVEAFGAAAGRVAQAGLDGVELNGGQFSLLRQFLSPLTNHRQDAWGGDLPGRLRFPLAVLAAVRAALGTDKLLGLKLCGDELAPWGGLTPEDAVAIARAVVATGTVDYLSLQIGGPFSVHMTEAAMPVPQAHAAHLAHAVREGIAQAAPVFAEGRIEAPRVAEDVIERGQADAVVMTRALVSDPDLPRKLAGDCAAPVRPHIGMTRYFSVQGDWNRPLSDLINPRAGREQSLPAVAPAPRPERVLVIGAGPAGMQAAVTLAEQGHVVTLREAQHEPGGMARRLAAGVEARREFAALVDYYTSRLAGLGVEMALDRPVVAAEAGLDAYARIYVATGARPPTGGPAGLPEAGACTPRELIAGRPSPAPPAAGRVAVVDSELGFRMANVVEWLLAAGYGVDILTEDFFVGRGLVESAEFLWFQRVAQQDCVQHAATVVSGLDGGTLVYRERFSGREHRLGPVAFVVAAQPELPEDALARGLASRHPRVVTLGDARAPRLMGEAIQHAYRTVLTERTEHTDA